MDNTVNAIVLAGTHADKSKLIYGGNKAFLEINGRPLITNVFNALKKAEYINKNKITVVGPRKRLEKIIDTEIIKESKAPTESRRFIENASRGYDTLSPNGERTLFVPSDLPFVSSKTIDDFILQCNDYEAAFYFAVINAKNIPSDLDFFKKSARFYLRDKGYFRTANMVLIEGSKIKNREFLELKIKKAFPMRRITSKLSRLRLYWFIARNYPIEILKYLFRYLREEDIEFAFKRKPGISFKLIETRWNKNS